MVHGEAKHIMVIIKQLYDILICNKEVKATKHFTSRHESQD